MIKAIIFDFDGTLSNRQANAYGVFDLYLRQFFKDFSDIEYEAVLQDMVTDDANGSFDCHLRLPPFVAKYKDYLPVGFEEDFITFYYGHMGEFVVLKKETMDVVRKLRPNYKLAVLSNGKTQEQRSKIDRVCDSTMFDEIIVSSEVGIPKPDPRVFELMANRLGVKCEECIFVGDTFSSDILGAVRSHMIPVWIVADKDRPYKYYDGYLIRKLDELFNILEIENKK